MRCLAHIAIVVAGLLIGSGGARAAACDAPDRALGVDRIVEIDTSSGPLFGDISLLKREAGFLQPREVVLTFDDGPMPWITSSILDTLDRFCTKATFFSVGRMAVAYPASVQDIMARGHTMGSHTWSHPLNLKRLTLKRATDEIERGFAAIAMAAGQPIAPFFRFPGLNDSDPMMAHLQSRGIGAFTVDVVSNDSYIADPKRLTDTTLREVDRRGGGIILFHDIKTSTAKALPAILTGLKQRGYKVVHMRPQSPLVPVDTFDEELAALLSKATARADSKETRLVPFFGEAGVLKSLRGEDLEVAAIAPPPRDRTGAFTHPVTDMARSSKTKTNRDRPRNADKRASKPKRPGKPPDPPFSLFGF